jgi:hypothetical protein
LETVGRAEQVTGISPHDPESDQIPELHVARRVPENPDVHVGTHEDPLKKFGSVEAQEPRSAPVGIAGRVRQEGLEVLEQIPEIVQIPEEHVALGVPK